MGGNRKPTADFQEMQGQRALQRLHQVARQRFGLREKADAFKRLALNREVWLPITGLTKAENWTLFREWKRRRRLNKETP